MIQELKYSKNVGFFFKNHYFSIFKHFRGFLLRLYLRGGVVLAPYQFQCLAFFDFSSNAFISVTNVEKKQNFTQ